MQLLIEAICPKAKAKKISEAPRGQGASSTTSLIAWLKIREGLVTPSGECW